MRAFGLLLLVLASPALAQQSTKPEKTAIDVSLEHIDDYVVRLQVKDRAVGTGFVVSFPPNKYIVTAHHVVDACAKDEAGCVVAFSSWYSVDGKERWLDGQSADGVAEQFDERISTVVRAFNDDWDIAILQVTTDLFDHPHAPVVNSTRTKFKLTEPVYLYGKPYKVRGKYPGVLRSGVVGGYFDYEDQSRLLLDIRTTGGDSGSPVLHAGSGRIIGVAVGNIIQGRRAEVTLRVETSNELRDYDLSEEVSGICSVVPLFYVYELAKQSNLWGQQPTPSDGSAPHE